MKTKQNWTYLWVIFITLAVAFVGCGKEIDPTPIDPSDTSGHGSTNDSVIVEITLDLPDCVILSQSQVKLIDSVFQDGLSYEVSNDNKRVFRFASADKKLIGSKCLCTSILEGRCNDYPACFDYEGLPDIGQTIFLKKGLNKVTLKYSVRI